jgi:recombination protein RecR
MTRLISEFAKMPGIGPRSANRMAFHVLQAPPDEIKDLISTISEVKSRVRFCRECNNLSDSEVCGICSDSSRDRSRIFVVESPGGVINMEKAGVYNGLYHVLLGELSPVDGVGPEDIKLEGLVERVKDPGVREVVIATDFSTEGETTALYLARILKPFKVRVTRLSRGVPVGGSLENVDIATVQRAFEERR